MPVPARSVSSACGPLGAAQAVWTQRHRPAAPAGCLLGFPAAAQVVRNFSFPTNATYKTKEAMDLLNYPPDGTSL